MGGWGAAQPPGESLRSAVAGPKQKEAQLGLSARLSMEVLHRSSRGMNVIASWGPGRVWVLRGPAPSQRDMGGGCSGRFCCWRHLGGFGVQDRLRCQLRCPRADRQQPCCSAWLPPPAGSARLRGAVISRGRMAGVHACAGC